MLHHVSLEIRPEDVERSVEFFELLGFERVPAPDEIAEHVTWLEREGSQVHFIHTPEATTPPLGHPAVVAPDGFEATITRLRDAGFKVEASRDLWGEARVFALMPGGQRVEVMAAPPPPAA